MDRVRVRPWEVGELRELAQRLSSGEVVEEREDVKRVSEDSPEEEKECSGEGKGSTLRG